MTLSSNAIGNWTGLNGSSCGEDSQVPGIEITCTSGQLASWNSGRGFFVGRPPALAVGGTAVGGTAVGGVSGWRSTTTTIATTNTTTRAIAPAATSARMRWRFRRRSVEMSSAMFSC